MRHVPAHGIAGRRLGREYLRNIPRREHTAKADRLRILGVWKNDGIDAFCIQQPFGQPKAFHNVCFRTCGNKRLPQTKCGFAVRIDNEIEGFKVVIVGTLRRDAVALSAWSKA